MRLTEVFVIVLVAGILVTMLLPAVLHSRHVVRDRKSIATTLQRIEAAKNQWALERRKRKGDVVTLQDLVKGGYLAPAPRTPSGGKYVVGAIGTLPQYNEDGGNKTNRRDDRDNREWHDHDVAP